VKLLITAVSTSLLTATFLYPLLYLGSGRGVSWPLVAAMAAGGGAGVYVLVRFRKRL
jgi:hypothetical protein